MGGAILRYELRGIGVELARWVRAVLLVGFGGVRAKRSGRVFCFGRCALSCPGGQATNHSIAM